MLISASYDDFASAYPGILRHLLDHGDDVNAVVDPRSPASRFGVAHRKTRELIGASFNIRDARYCLAASPPRPVRLAYCVGSLLWAIAGSDELQAIAFYNPLGTSFSDDGAHLSGAFGRRLFKGLGGVNQIDAIVQRLRLDRSGRRTVGVIIEPQDNVRESREYPCAIAVQYLIRGERLHAITYMRSQSAVMVLPYDSFLFMALQCVIASRLNIDVGHYSHLSGSLHIYEDELDLAMRVAALPAASIRLDTIFDTLAAIEDVIALEARIRAAAVENDVGALNEIRRGNDMEQRSNRCAIRILLSHAYMSMGMADTASEEVAKLPAELSALMIECHRKSNDDIK